MLSIAKDNKIFLGGTQVTWKDLEAKLKANERVQKESALYIEADTHLPYGVVITAMAVAKNAGVAKVMMLTDPARSTSKLGRARPRPSARWQRLSRHGAQGQPRCTVMSVARQRPS